MAVRKLSLAYERVCDPVFRAINNNEYLAGELLKNYSRYPW